MNARFETMERASGTSTDVRSSERRSRRFAAPYLLVATCAGCASSNYDFQAISELSGDSRGARLTEDLVLEWEEGDDRELYDFEMIPLAHTHLELFAESDDEDVPEGYVEAELDAYLPLFGFVDATVNRYDDDRRLYEGHEYDSYFWGLIQSHREQVDTPHGMREQKRRRFLWLFEWDSSPRYVDTAHEAAAR